MVDIIVIGAGPAGLCAAIYASRAGKSVKILEKSTFGGQMTFSPKIENYPAEMVISGAELADKMVEHALSLGVEIELEEVLKIENSDDVKTVVTDTATHTCRAVIIATGAHHRKLGVEGEDKFEGSGVSFCAVCDGAFYAGQDVVVVGGGNSALQETLLLSEICKSVTVVQNLDFFTGEGKLVEQVMKKENVKTVLGAVVEKVVGEDKFEGVEIVFADGRKEKIIADGMFVAIGLKPENEAFSNVTALDKIGYIVSDESCTTSSEGVFVAGDCRTKNIRQIATAVSDGAVAALAAVRYIG